MDEFVQQHEDRLMGVGAVPEGVVVEVDALVLPAALAELATAHICEGYLPTRRPGDSEHVRPHLPAASAAMVCRWVFLALHDGLTQSGAG
jgi:hypothetical protein